MASQDDARPAPRLAAAGLRLTRARRDRPPFHLRVERLDLRAGELTVLQGGSGGGKSTLLQALAGLLPLDAGIVRLAGEPMEAVPPPQWRTRVSLVHAVPLLLEGTLADNLTLPWQFKAMRGRPRPNEEAMSEGLARLGLEEMEPAVAVGALSDGQRERVALLRGLLVAPEVLLLDEPVANLDPATAARVWTALRRFREETGAAMLCATHQPPADHDGPALTMAAGVLSGGAP